MGDLLGEGAEVGFGEVVGGGGSGGVQDCGFCCVTFGVIWGGC